MFVIKFEEGTYNQGPGHEASLEECTKYGTLREAELAAEELMGVVGILPYETERSSFTIAQLIEAIEASTKQVKICVPSTDFYRRSEDFETDTISIIDPSLLLSALRSLS